MSVLICRPLEDSVDLSKSLDELGISNFVLPTIFIENISININISTFTDFVFTSKYAVKNFFSQYSPSFLINTNIYAVGVSTATLIEGFGLKCQYPEKFDSYNLLRLIQETPTLDRKFIVIAGVGGNTYLVDELSKVTTCEKLEVYRRTNICENKLMREYSKQYQKIVPEIIVVTSIDVFRSLSRIFCKISAPYDSKITVISSKMLKLVKDTGFNKTIKLKQLNNRYICEMIEKIIRGNK